MKQPNANGAAPRVTRLPSGLSVVSEHSVQMRTVALGVWVRAGARDESEAEHGLSHFLEHMAFKGTRRRSARAIVEEIETVGGELNAETTVETTAYYARVMGEDVGVALDILADILADSSFEDEELVREKGVIVQEIAAADDDPEDLTGDRFLETAFPRQAIGRPILGTVETVTAFDKRAIRAYLKRNYLSPGIVVAATGAVDHDRLVELAATEFARMPSNPMPARTVAGYRGGEMRIARRLEQAHIMLGFPGVSYHDEDAYAVGAFTGAMGGGMSSRLFQEVREKRGLAYNIDAFHWTFGDCGAFGVSAGAGEHGAGELVPVVLDELARAIDDLSEAEVERAKAQMRVSLMSGFESPGRRTEQIARQLIAYGRVLTPAEILARINGVDVVAVRAAGRRVLSGPPTVVAVGPLKNVPRLDEIAARIGAPMPASG